MPIKGKLSVVKKKASVAFNSAACFKVGAAGGMIACAAVAATVPGAFPLIIIAPVLLVPLAIFSKQPALSTMWLQRRAEKKKKLSDKKPGL